MPRPTHSRPRQCKLLGRTLLINLFQNRFAQQPEIYKQFLEILQTYQRESKPIQDVYSQVTQLFGSAPDLLEDFKQFLPESAAHAKAQASARAAVNDDMILPTSNVRGDPGYGGGQIAQAQTPRPAAKMPPMGQFDPPSTSKENKKRRGGPGATATQGPPIALDSSLGAQGSRAGAVQVGNANKVNTTPLSFHNFNLSESFCDSILNACHSTIG
jgi:paired amphipathic helix protein Sin3a